jgi:hypothetical protein
MNLAKKSPASSVLGLSLDAARLEGGVLRRTNGSATLQKSFAASLALDPLTNDPELVGREIRNHLDKAGIRERRCAVCVPLNWALTLQTKLPDLPESDVPSFLAIEAERGFPYGPDALLISTSRLRLDSGAQYATQVAVVRDHVARLEKALRAARLKPVTFSLGPVALQSPGLNASDGVMALAIGESGIGLQVSCAGGIAALRSLEGTLENEGGLKRLQSDVVAREVRITLGQLPPEIRSSLRRVKIFGSGDLPSQLLQELRPRLDPALKLELAGPPTAENLGLQAPPEASGSPALSLAARYLARRSPALEFLPPKTSPWRQFSTRYSSRKLVWAGATAGAAALLVAGAFGIQQWRLSKLRSQWVAMAPTVAELEDVQQQIRKYRPWFDESFRTLSILRKLTEAFPADGVVTAKTFEIRDLSSVTCSGTARDNESFLKMLEQLRNTKEVAQLKVDNLRGSGRAPLQFSFNFRWEPGGAGEH